MLGVLRDVLEQIWVQGVYPLVVAQIVQLEFILDPNLLLLQFFFLSISSPWLPSQSSLLLLTSEIDVTILPPPVEVQHPNSLNRQVLLHELVQRTVCHEAR